MSYKKIEENMNLAKIEAILRERANGITIISQISISTNELNILIKTTRVPLRTADQKHMIKTLWGSYPYCCLTLTVFIAIFKYDGNFWDRFRSMIRIEKTGLWKTLFLETINNKGLVNFDKSGTQKYLNNILGHAGIPKANVKSFITDIIFPAIENNLDAEEICQEFRRGTHTYIKPYNLYKGVIDFIKMGDIVSLNLIDRCLQIWKEQETPFLKKSKGLIPKHLLIEFDKYLKENDEITITSRIPNPKPRLTVNPNKLIVSINLPIFKSNDSMLSDVKWLIVDNLNGNTVTIDTTKVRLSNNINEFLIEDYQKEFAVEPNKQYTVKLFLNNILVSEQAYDTSDLMLFNYQTNEFTGILSKEYKELYIIVANKYLRDELKLNSPTFIYNMNADWNHYSLIEIEATHIEEMKIGDKTILLNNKDSNPSLIGKQIDHITHERLPVFNSFPNILIPREFTPFFNNKSNWHIKINAKNNADTKIIALEKLKKVYTEDSGVRIILDETGLLKDMDFGEFEITLYGPLGTDVRLKFIVGKDIDLKITKNSYQSKMNLKTISFYTHRNYSAEVIWPNHLNVQRKHERSNIVNSQIECSTDQYKLIVQFTNLVTRESLPLIVYTKPYDIKVTYGDNTFFEGSMTDKTKMDLDEAYLHIDLENPFLNKYKSYDNHILLTSYSSGKIQRTFPKPIKMGKKSVIPLKYFNESSNKNNISLVYRIPALNKEDKRLLFIDNDWKLEYFKYKELDEAIQVEWKENFSLENMKLKVWQLNDLQKASKTVDLKKSQTATSIEINNPGYYLLEWEEGNENPFGFLLGDQQTKPSFKSDKYRIVKVNTDYSLSILTLLNDNHGEEYEWEENEFLGLMKSIQRFGQDYMQLLLEDYDSCCDFGIRNIGLLIQLLSNSKADKELVDICLKISGFQEWDKDSLLTCISEEIQPGIEEKLDEIDFDNFGDGKAAESFASSIPAQLNVLYQQTPFEDSIVKGFSHIHAHIEFVKKIKQNAGYFHQVEQLLESEKLYINGLYRKLKTSNKFDYRMFNIVNKREYFIQTFQMFEYPSLIAKVALFNRLLSIAEFTFTENDRKRIRLITKWLLQSDRNWFIHDLVYLSFLYENIQKQKKYNKERGTRSGYTSFKWKERY
ncbi:hypothetical protein CIB95_08945 [Lottiidibacillus patelloidae]|uniref:Uncharacterized protein n=1 Tax=Lottiidibacillus patelloidae TaxID=2670334 RepID=A0A263BU83_9BACI|nr:hypothetical protein [Lottiidibacillus patelloidae]OZM56887.1 hypothetical protein CIB95_08945 [Lottiidibacillus patelloidae]